MLMLVRSALGLCGLLAGWFLSYWVYFARYDLDGRAFMGRGVPFLIGVGAAAVVIAVTASLRHGFITAVVLGALGLGGLGFLLGCVGPVIIDPEADQGVLLGLLTTAPGGFLLGGPLGALWWWVRLGRATA